MSSLLRSAAAATLVSAAVASPASAAWTPPTTLASADEANPLAQAAFDGSVLTGWLTPTASLSKRRGTPVPITAADPFEKVWAGGLDKDGNAIVLTVRKHKPLQRIRAIFVAADGTRSATRTISDNTHSAAQPTLSVAPDGTAVAAWAWHDPAGWRAQVAIRRPGQPRFDKPQTVSPPAPTIGRSHPRPFVRVAAGDGGRAVPDQPARRLGHRRQPARRARRPLDRRQGHDLRHAGRDRVLRRRHHHRGLGQARQPLRGRRPARSLHPRAGSRGVRPRADAHRSRSRARRSQPG